MVNSLITLIGYGFTNSEKESNILNGYVFSCLAIYNFIFLFSTLHSLPVKEQYWTFDQFLLVKNYLKESLLSIFCFTIQGKGSSENWV